MNRIGNVFSFIFNKFFLSLLVITTLGFLPVLGIASTVTDRETVKTLLSNSDVYNTAIDNILDIVTINENNLTNDGQTNQQNQPQFAQQEPSLDPQQGGEFNSDANKAPQKTLRALMEENGFINPDELLTTVKSSIDPSFLQGIVESLIDSSYDFIDGTTDELSYTISLSSRAEVTATAFKAFAQKSLASIPACTTDSVDKEGDFDLLEIDCLPPGLEIIDEIDKFIDEATAADGILGETFTEEDLGVSSVDLEFARLGHKALSKSALIYWTVLLTLSTVVIMTSGNTHRGFKEVGIIHFVAGGIMLVGFSALGSSVDLLNNVVLENTRDMSEAQVRAITNIAEPLVDSVVAQVSSKVTSVAIFVMGLGVISFVAGIVLSKHHVEHITLPHHGHEGAKPKGPKNKVDNPDELALEDSKKFDSKPKSLKNKNAPTKKVSQITDLSGTKPVNKKSASKNK